MEKLVPIYQDRDFYVPAFEIRVNGELLPDYASKDVIDVQYTDSVKEIDSFIITVNNWDAEKLDFKYTGSTREEAGTKKEATPPKLKPRSLLFDPGKVIELWMGHLKPTKENSDSLRLMLIGKITKVAPNFPASGQSTLKVSGQNVLRQFKTKQETHDYPQKRYSEIAKEISTKRPLKDTNGKSIPILVNRDARDLEKPEHYTGQKNQFDIVFLLQLARRKSYELIFISDEKDPRYRNIKAHLDEQKKPPFLYFGPSIKFSEIFYLLEWGKSLIQFQPILTTTNQVSQVTVQGWDSLRKKPIQVTVKRQDLKTRSQGDKQRMQQLEEGFKDHKEVVVDRPVFNEQDAKQLAEAMMTNNSKDMVTGQGSTIGIPDLRAGSFVRIEGLGLTFSGRYFLESTTHTINTSGYVTNFEARREEENNE